MDAIRNFWPGMMLTNQGNPKYTYDSYPPIPGKNSLTPIAGKQKSSKTNPMDPPNYSMREESTSEICKMAIRYPHPMKFVIAAQSEKAG
jgi:hypothetical protein